MRGFPTHIIRWAHSLQQRMAQSGAASRSSPKDTNKPAAQRSAQRLTRFVMPVWIYTRTENAKDILLCLNWISLQTVDDFCCCGSTQGGGRAGLYFARGGSRRRCAARREPHLARHGQRASGGAVRVRVRGYRRAALGLPRICCAHSGNQFVHVFGQ